MPVEDPYIQIGQFCTVVYFAYYLVILPGLGLLERALTKQILKQA